MKIIDRICLVVFSIIILAGALITGFVISGWIEIDLIADVTTKVLSNHVTGPIALGLSMLFSILSVKCIFFSQTSKEKSREGILLENENGKLLVSKDTVENITTSVIKNFESVENSNTRVDVDNENKISIYITLAVYSEAIIKDLAAKNEWNEYYNTNAVNKFRKYTIKYVLVWAKYMQHIMSKHNKNVAEIANETSYVCDIDGVTIDMYAYAILLLSKYWKYGEELRRWHNSKYGVEDEENVISFVCTIKT